MLKKHYEIFCDNCGKLLATVDTLPSTTEGFKKLGIFVRGKKHYCNKECYDDWKRHVNRTKREII